MRMIPSGLKKEMRARHRTLVKEAGRYITIYGQDLKEDCPNCHHDHTGASVNKFNSAFVTPVVIFDTTYSPEPFTRGRCPICEGAGHIAQEDTHRIKTLVLWNPAGVADSKGAFDTTPAGLEGTNVVRIKAAKCYYDIIRDCTKAVIDDVDCSLALPPVLRTSGEIDVMTTAYFVATEVGHNVRG